MIEVPRDILDAARGWLLENRGDHRFQRFAPVPDGLVPLQRAAGAEQARVCLVNWTQALSWHRDRTAPYPCENVVVILRAGADGGDLEFPGGRVVECPDGAVVRFDGQVKHQVSRITLTSPLGYRCSVLFYVPT